MRVLLVPGLVRGEDVSGSGPGSQIPGEGGAGGLLAQGGELLPERLVDVNQLFAERRHAVAGHR